jgi:hypothetical protein
MKTFWLGFIVATTLWVGVMSLIEIPEYTIIHKNTGVCT